MFLRAGRRANKKSLTRVSYGRTSFVLGLALSLAFFSGVPKALAGVENDPNLAKLEVKFFQHDYGKTDDAETRLSRLEKLMYGAEQKGEPQARLKNLLSAVTDLDPHADADAPQTTGDTPSANGGGGKTALDPSEDSAPPSRTASRSSSRRTDFVEREQTIEDGSDYPAVTAMEQKIFKKSFVKDPIATRLARLETNQFGAPSKSDDLSDRVDQLKAKTGIDLAKNPPPNTDWADEDDDNMPIKRGGGDIAFTPGKLTPYSSPPDEDGKTMSGRDLRKDFQQAFGRPATSQWGDDNGVVGGGTPSSSSGITSPTRGSYGMGGDESGSYRSSRGSYGSGSGTSNPARSSSSRSRSSALSSAMPPTAPDVVHERDIAPAPAMGLSQQLAVLENTVFGKTNSSDTIPGRLNRLEMTVLGSKVSTSGMSLPDRVRRLCKAVEVNPSSSRQISSSGAGSVDDPAMPKPAPSRSNMSRILNKMGNMVSGGSYGAYPMGNSSLVNDPTTGLLYDPSTGNLINPSTGVVMGNRSTTGMSMGSGGMQQSYSGFGNGLSPMSRPTVNFGIGRGIGGMGFGTGMMGSGMGVGTRP